VEVDYLTGPIVEQAPWSDEPSADPPPPGHDLLGVEWPEWHSPEAVATGCYVCPSKTRACK
jgi:hypothetical protein